MIKEYNLEPLKEIFNLTISTVDVTLVQKDGDTFIDHKKKLEDKIRIEFEDYGAEGTYCVRYDKTTGRLEFLEGETENPESKVVCYSTKFGTFAIFKKEEIASEGLWVLFIF